MDKGWCLTLNSDPIISSVDSFARCKRDSVDHMAADDRSGSLSIFPSSDDHKLTAVGEVDFFSDEKKAVSNEESGSAIAVNVKKEISLEKAVNTGLHLVTANTGSDQSALDEEVDHNKLSKNQLTQLQVEIQKMNTENQRLRDMLSHVTHNYNALHMHLVTLMQQNSQQNDVVKSTLERELVEAKADEIKRKDQTGPRTFLDLGHATSAAENEVVSNSSSDERTRSGSPPNNLRSTVSVKNSGNLDHQETSNLHNGKRVGRNDTPDSDSQGWNSSKVLKLNDAGNNPAEQSAEATVRKARVSVRAHSEAAMITDGCQWRKYGQKMAKGNPCPRAYYRCTMAVGCPVRKQVQRCAEDRTVLITTYEGSHNHPLPPAAMAMASTTTAAANMLLSGSMSSADGLTNSNLLARAILPCSTSAATISASAPFPTVTLDLTQSQNPSHQSQNPSQFQRQPNQFQFPFQGHPPTFPSASSAPQLPHVLGHSLYNQSKFSGLQMSQEIGANQSPQLCLAGGVQQSPSDSVNAATAAITADPNFTAALAAAIASMIGGTNATTSVNNNNS